MIRRALLLATVVVALPVSAALPASAEGALRSHGGKTSDGQPIVLSFDARSGRLERVVAMFTARCRSGKGYSFGHRLTRQPGRPTEPELGEYPLTVKMGRGGRFTAAGIAFEPLAEGRIGGIALVFRGRVRGNRVTGTMRADVAVGSETSGDEPEDTCTYSRKTFSAIRARGRVLTGETSQSLPVVLTLARNARSVSVIRIGWNAGCEPPGFIQIPDELLRFRIRGGRFGDEFDHTIRLDDGTERIFRYDVDGRANRVRASGTIEVEMEDRGGPAPGTCRSETVRWRAS